MHEFSWVSTVNWLTNLKIFNCLRSGLPAITDLAAMRDAAVRLGADPFLIQPKVSTTLLLDYYNIEADVARKYKLI